MGIFYLEPTQFIHTLKGSYRADQLKTGLVIRTIDGKIQTIEKISKEEIVCKDIVFSNNEKIVLPMKTIIKNHQDKMLVHDLKSGENVQFQFFNFFNNQNKKAIFWEDQFRTYALPVKIPKDSSNELALFMGIVAAKGIIRDTGNIAFELTNKEESIKQRIISVVKEVFQLTPDVKVFQDRTFISLNSRNLQNFLKQELGWSKTIGKVPLFLREASLSEKLSFISGLTLRAYKDRTTLFICSHPSILLIEFVASVLKSIGYGISIKTYESKENQKLYGLKVLFKHHEAITFECLNPLVKLESIRERFLSLVPYEAIDNVSINSQASTYSSFKRLKKDKPLFCNQEILTDFGIPSPAIYFLQVDSVKLIKKEMIKIETNQDLGIVLDGLSIF